MGSPPHSSRTRKDSMPRGDEWRRRTERPEPAEGAQPDDQSTPAPAEPDNAVHGGATDEDSLARLDAELDEFVTLSEGLTAALDLAVPTAVGATQAKSIPIVPADKSLVNWVRGSVLGESRQVTGVVVAWLGVLIMAIPLKASLPISTSVILLVVGMLMTWVVGVGLARRAD